LDFDLGDQAVFEHGVKLIACIAHRFFITPPFDFPGPKSDCRDDLSMINTEVAGRWFYVFQPQ
jgi:hypothetical protein